MMLFEKEYELRGSDFDCCDRLHPSSIMDLFQDAAGIHAVELGVGFDDLMARQMIWVLTKVKYQVVGEAKRYTRVRVRTWPLPAGKVTCRREYEIESPDGTPIVRGTSEWVVVHSEKRRVLPAGDIYPHEEYCTRQLFDGKLRKVPAIAAEGEGRRVVPAYTHLDINGHVNNTKYADYVMDLLQLPAGQTVTEWQIDYHREVLHGQELQLYRDEQDGTTVVCGKSGEGETMFSCAVTVKIV